ncbi:PEP-CTERM sorting domain-containing protein [Akkermansia sp.]|uniref:PEP-CTERM sorting domain-containing protein n=1 Tax=Akkermansia sp. TaxID=1872421 RepID=UPI0025BF98EB|nr:PEP-CTERM sorting domain-containing protein [Akkermansia sp.]MCC8149796.1 PEP-CTERM sorting domain-containing protein [Akkermansia sp.]
MKKTLWSICIGLAGLAAAASAATVELMPDIESIARQGYNSSGRLAGNGITATDVKSWLGSSSRADGWYTTTGNGDMNWGQASVNTGNQSITLPNMNGTAGVCAGLKMTIENIQTYEGLAFSFTLTPPGTGPTFTYSLWYETTDGDIVELCKGSRGNNGSVWNVSYDLTGEQMADMKANGNGKVYAVLGSAGGNNGNNAVITDISLEGTLAVPEPATASLGLLGLAALMLRRRRVA